MIKHDTKHLVRRYPESGNPDDYTNVLAGTSSTSNLPWAYDMALGIEVKVDRIWSARLPMPTISRWNCLMRSPLILPERFLRLSRQGLKQ